MSRRVFRETCASGAVNGARKEGKAWICARSAWHEARARGPAAAPAPAMRPPAPEQPSTPAAPKPPTTAPANTDEAIRAAAKLAIDAGDFPRARALLDLLDAKPRAAPVLALATRKPPR